MQEGIDRDQGGIIFNLQRFSLHDGLGIRTTVFLKGCPLRCVWCANPESQSAAPQLMVRQIRCLGCGSCLDHCPQGALSLEAGTRRIDWSRCDQCLHCVPACPNQSLLICGSTVTPQEVVQKCLRDKPFYDRSGGGVTLSGGEPLTQSRFVLEILRQCKTLGLHTALETSGFAPWPVLASVLPVLDSLLFDLKHLDAEKHRQATGVDNGLILENLKRAAAAGSVIWLRIPLIAGFNDEEDHFRKICALAKTCRVQKISLLPYHEGGKGKCEQIGLSYRAAQATSPSQEGLELLKRIADENGVPISMGY